MKSLYKVVGVCIALQLAFTAPTVYASASFLIAFPPQEGGLKDATCAWTLSPSAQVPPCNGQWGSGYVYGSGLSKLKFSLSGQTTKGTQCTFSTSNMDWITLNDLNVQPPNTIYGTPSTCQFTLVSQKESEGAWQLQYNFKEASSS